MASQRIGGFHRTAVHAVAVALFTGAACLPLRVAHAQGDALPDRGDVAGTSGAPQCDGELIREIVIYSSAPVLVGVHRVPLLGDIARATHATTHPDILRRFLLLEEGGRCSELARAESERVLRAQPFIADATITVVPVDGAVRLDVRTIDESAMVFGARVLSGNPLVRSLRLGNGNLAGRGIYLSGDWRAGGAMRDGAGVTLEDYQLFGKPYVLHLQARRSPLGGEWHGALTRPFLTGLQRQGWRAGAGEVAGFTELQHPDSATHAVRFERRYADAGAMARIGPPVRMALLGLVVSHERETVAGHVTAFAPDGTPLGGRDMGAATGYASTRINAFGGYRSIEFVRVEGFDALSATQDIPTGVQAGVVVGRGLDRPVDGGRGRELFLAADVYAGRGDDDDATRVQLRAQGARAAGSGDWGRVFATGSVSQVYKPSVRHTMEASGHWALAWHPGLPVQLLLGARNGGVRGYDHARAGGGRRASVRLEDRHLLGKVGTVGEFGIAGFAEAGRVWRGDAPFGVTTPVSTAIGLSVLAAVPARSARLWRVDLAFPLQGRSAGRLELGFSNGNRTSVFWREPRDMASVRGRAVPASVFAWP